MQNSIVYKNTKISFSSKGKGAAIVFLHGFLENSSMWKPFTEVLSTNNRVICIDLLGHGNSDCMGYVHSMELMADAVEAVLRHLRIRKPIVIGHSMGGYVALAFAEKNVDKIKGFCLMNSSAKEDDIERKKLRIRANKLVPKNFKSMVQLSFANLFSEQSRAVFKNEMNVGIQDALKTSIQGYIACQEGMIIRPNREHVLQKLSCKKLLIIGKEDPVLELETSLKEGRKYHMETVVFNDGHMSHIENKNDLILVLKKFVIAVKKGN